MDETTTSATEAELVTEEAVGASEAEEASGPKQLRDALKREQEKSAKYRAQLMAQAYKEVGLNPEQGLGKAIAKEFDGEPTAEALATYAREEYGYEKAEAPENPVEPQIIAGQAVVDSVGDVSTSVEPTTQQEQLVAAEREKDHVTAGNIKAQQLRKLMTNR